MNILDNELVKKYFGCKGLRCVDDHYQYPCPYMCRRVLAAMQEPIRRGERVLEVGTPDDNYVVREKDGPEFDYFHPWFLRIPSSFQPKAEKICSQCGQAMADRACGPTHAMLKAEKPDPVESAITEVVNMCGFYNSSGLEMKLRNLVALARGSK